MVKILVAYFSPLQKGKVSNEEKIVHELENFFSEKKQLVQTISLTSKKDLSLKDQFKLEKELEISQKIPRLDLFDLVIIGSPVVGSLTSAPLVNAFIRLNVKQTQENAIPKFALFSSGVLQGFAVKKMQSLLSMKGIKPIENEAFASIFDFDAKKMIEVRRFAQKILEKIEN